MIGYRALLRQSVSVKHGVVQTSDTGDTRVVYPDTPDVTGLACSIQDAGGEMQQTDFGRVPGRRKSITFGPEASGVVLQNDLLVTEQVPVETYLVKHTHVSNAGTESEHLETSCLQWSLAGEV